MSPFHDKHMPQPSEIGQDLRERGYDSGKDNLSASERRLSAIAQALSERGYDVMISDHCVIVRGSTSLKSTDDDLLNHLGIYWERSGEDCALIPKERYADYRGDDR